MLLSVIENVWDFLVRLTSNGLSKDLLFYVSLGFATLMVLFFMIKSRYAYEGRLLRILEKLNRWLYSNQQIDETNIVDFNNMLKKAPRLLRYHWQQYMLYREHEPSYYMSMYNCIEKPLHTSSYKANIKSYTWICGATMAVSFLFSLIGYGKSSLTVEAIAVPLITPVIILVLSVLFVMLLRLMQNSTLSSLYQNFHLFNRYVDKASATIPKFVDFEILFTRKEISGGIPVLNEYLERRARLEAEELEKARQNAVEHEVYSFENAGIDGSLILDRAMKESETFINTRQRLLTQIQQYDSEIESLRRNFENTSKDYQRKLQASKENVERLRQQQEESTNRIEVNYIRKQQQDEIKKQEQLEKDQDSATIRYEDETSALQQQIDKCRAELDEKKTYAQGVMLSEYDTFATKIYKAILKDVEGKHQDEIDAITEQKNDIQKELEQAKEINDIKDGLIEDLKMFLRNPDAFADPDEKVAEEPEEVEEVENESAEEVVEETPVEEAAQESAEDGHYDENGYYWFDNGTYYDNYGYYHDAQNDIYDAEGNFISPEQYAELTKPAQEVQEEEPAVEEPVVEETPVKEVPVVEEQPVEEPVVEESAEEVVEEQPVEENADDPFAGHYEEDGRYVFNNGSFYDTLGYYHDVENNVYDQDGNYVTPERFAEITGQTLETPVEETAVEEAPVVEEQPVEEVAEEQPVEEVPVSEPVAEEPAEEEAVEDEEPVITEVSVEEIASEVAPEEEQAAEEEQPRRGRGRPKKVVEEVEEEQPHRGRGRPKKAEEPAEEVKAEPSRGRGRPKKVVEEAPIIEEKAHRGRPKKQVVEPAEEAKTEPSRGRGRPKKVVEEVPATEEKAHRGRPKKQVAEPAEETKAEPSRGRGRPKKVVEEVKAEPSRGRGRPRKNA